MITAGERFGRLTAIRFDHLGRLGGNYWLFRCDCGTEIVLIESRVKCVSTPHNDLTKSCSCLAHEPYLYNDALRDLLPKDLVHKLYIEEDNTAPEIAERYGVSLKTFRNLLGIYGFRKAKTNPGVYEHLTKEKIELLYWGQEMSLTEISEGCGATPSTILLRMKKFGIPLRDRFQAYKLSIDKRKQT